MNGPQPLTGEYSNSKVAGVFASETQARQAAVAVRTELSLGDAQVQLVAPGDPHPGRRMEPESQGIFRTIIVAHYKLGLVGAVAGVVLFAVLYGLAIPAVTQSWPLTLFATVFFCATFGLMLGGLVSLRPDHDPYIAAVQSALSSGRHVVLVHAFSSEQRAQAEAVLKARGGETTSTL